MSSIHERVRNVFKDSSEKKLDRILQQNIEHGVNGHIHQEWRSPDGKKVIISDATGGTEYNNASTLEIALMSEGEFGRNNLMKITKVKRPSTSLTQIVSLDAISDDKTDTTIPSISYSSENGGIIRQPNLWSRSVRTFNQLHISRGEFHSTWINDIRRQGFYEEHELPAEIDVEATTKAFMEQLSRRDFSRPQLIQKKQ